MSQSMLECSLSVPQHTLSSISDSRLLSICCYNTIASNTFNNICFRSLSHSVWGALSFHHMSMDSTKLRVLNLMTYNTLTSAPSHSYSMNLSKTFPFLFYIFILWYLCIYEKKNVFNTHECPPYSKITIVMIFTWWSGHKKIQHLNSGGRACVVYSMMTPALWTQQSFVHTLLSPLTVFLNYINYGWKSIPLSQI